MKTVLFVKKQVILSRTFILNFHHFNTDNSKYTILKSFKIVFHGSLINFVTTILSMNNLLGLVITIKEKNYFKYRKNANSKEYWLNEIYISEGLSNKLSNTDILLLP